MKSPEYIYAHRIASYHVFTKKRLISIVRAGGEQMEELFRRTPDSEVYVRYYQWCYARLKRDIEIAISKARALDEELSHDRRAVADTLCSEPLRVFCFKALGNNRTVEQLLAEMQDSGIAKLIPDHPQEE